MSEPVNEFVSLGMDLGPARLTISAPDVSGVLKHLNALAEIDEMDGLSVINGVLDHVETIKAAVTVKFGVSNAVANRPTVNNNTPAPSGEAPSCAHGPMKFKSGTSAKTQKPYSGYFCTGPYGPNQCAPIFNN